MKRKLQLKIKQHHRCIEISALLTMCAIWCFTGIMFFQGCGGSGGEAQDAPQQPGNASISCLDNNGQYWQCNEENTCFRDYQLEQEAESIDIVETEASSSAAINNSGGLDQLTPTTPVYTARLKDGTTIIIQGCDVNFTYTGERL